MPDFISGRRCFAARENMKEKTVVIGGGAAGMFSAVQLAKRGFDVTLLEKNEKLGKKIFITGKGRCNFTNDCDEETFFNSVKRNPRFLYSAYHAFNAQDAMHFFEAAGMSVKVERGSRAFPVSDHAYDVTDALKRMMKRYGVKTVLFAEVTEISVEGVRNDDSASLETNDTGTEKPHKEKKKKEPVYSGRVTGVQYRDVREPHKPGPITTIGCSRVVVATGGLSYPTTGSTGDGYRFAAQCGHAVTKQTPSLVPLLTAEDVSPMAGLSLRNVTLSIRKSGKKIFSGFGEMLFTHKGISGPLVLTASSVLADAAGDEEILGEIDLKPNVTGEEIDTRLLRMVSEQKHKKLLNILHEFLPASMIEPVLKVSGVNGEKTGAEVTKAERLAIGMAAKHFPLTITGTAGFNEAVITSGGVSVREIDPKTMMSRRIRGMYFAGEVIDVDALTGGFNLQIAWSTAYAAGNAE